MCIGLDQACAFIFLDQQGALAPLCLPPPPPSLHQWYQYMAKICVLVLKKSAFQHGCENYLYIISKMCIV